MMMKSTLSNPFLPFSGFWLKGGSRWQLAGEAGVVVVIGSLQKCNFILTRLLYDYNYNYNFILTRLLSYHQWKRELQNIHMCGHCHWSLVSPKVKAFHHQHHTMPLLSLRQMWVKSKIRARVENPFNADEICVDSLDAEWFRGKVYFFYPVSSRIAICEQRATLLFCIY